MFSSIIVRVKFDVMTVIKIFCTQTKTRAHAKYNEDTYMCVDMYGCVCVVTHKLATLETRTFHIPHTSSSSQVLPISLTTVCKRKYIYKI